MMTVQEFNTALAAHPQANVRFVLPDGRPVALHAHVTEVARLDKDFVDCGGTRRQEARCQLQTWVANDLEHRLTAGKLLRIMEAARVILRSEDLPVEVEHEAEWIGQFPVATAAHDGNGELVFQLTVRHTACLAPEQCLPKNLQSPLSFKPLPSFAPRG